MCEVDNIMDDLIDNLESCVLTVIGETTSATYTIE